YIPQGKIAGMSVVQIKMITGTVPDKDSLDQLSANPSNKILRADVEDNKVNLYLSEVSNYDMQFSFKVDEVIAVENLNLEQLKYSITMHLKILLQQHIPLKTRPNLDNFLDFQAKEP
ncbi:alpha-2-macroglobulin, partial [Trichonephila inaurata madagascariensis]